MPEFSRPATLDDLKQLLQALHDHHADYLLIGGYALAAHGYQRATTDIDLLVPARADAGVSLREALLTLPDRAAADMEPAWLEAGDNIRVADAFVVDVMVNANGHSYEALRSHEQRLDLDGVPVRTLDLAGLLLTKQTQRDKDIDDRAVLERAIDELSRLKKDAAP
jgi:hypothetical protein